jgi:hypothetical protein
MVYPISLRTNPAFILIYSLPPCGLMANREYNGKNNNFVCEIILIGMLGQPVYALSKVNIFSILWLVLSATGKLLFLEKRMVEYEIGAKLKKLRMARKMTLQAVADEIGF